MSLQELINAAKTAVITTKDIKALQARVKRSEEELEQNARSTSANQEFLARTYSL